MTESPVIFPHAKLLAKETLSREIAEHSLMKGCSNIDPRYLLGLFGGFWPFVEGFPAVIEGSYADLGRFASSDSQKRLIGRIGRMLAGSEKLAAMAKDETHHKAFWLLSAKQAGFDKEQLVSYPFPASSSRLAQDIQARPDFIAILMDFAAVEFVATAISDTLMESSAFREMMGDKGQRWFTEHFVASHEGTPHEDIALGFAQQMYPVLMDNDEAVLSDELVAELTIASGRRFIYCATDIVRVIHAQ